MREMMAMIKSMQNPASNPAQNFLTNEAIGAANFMKGGEFGKALPKGMFFNFQQPAEQVKEYEKLANVGKTGTFALGDGGGMGKAMSTQSQFLGDKFARDASQNYQNNIQGAAGQIQNSLGQAAGAKSQNDQAVFSAMQGLGGMPFMNKPSGWGAALGAIGGLGGGALSSLKAW